jgi:hypothetical protein
MSQAQEQGLGAAIVFARLCPAAMLQLSLINYGILNPAERGTRLRYFVSLERQ